MPNVIYTLDDAIESFFSASRTTATREDCDDFALYKFGEPVLPVPLQGMASYTVIANQSKIVQFREQTNLLDMEIMRLAKEIHPNVVANCTSHGLIKGSQTDDDKSEDLFPLAIYSMDVLPGNNYIFEARSLQSNLSAHLKTVKSLASFFAESWLNGRCKEPEVVPASITECTQMFQYLADTVPHRFQHHILRVEKLLPVIKYGEYPLVLTHGDLNEMNILVDPTIGNITGVIDWAEASILPFGFSLYALDNTLGYMGPTGWSYYENAKVLRDAFWAEFYSLVGDLSTDIVSYIQVARIAGILIRYGTNYDRGFGKIVGVRDSSDASLRYLDALLSDVA